jgi:hypothetical protein
MNVRVDENNHVRFKLQTTRWLEVFLDRKLSFQTHYNIIMAKVQIPHGKICSIAEKLELQPQNV